MKVFSVIAKLLVALAAIAGAIYVAATYGDKIVAWCKKLLGSFQCCCDDCCCDGECDCDCDCDCDCGCCCEEPGEVPAVEVPEVECPEDPEVEIEVVVAESEPVAEEHEFEA